MSCYFHVRNDTSKNTLQHQVVLLILFARNQVDRAARKQELESNHIYVISTRIEGDLQLDVLPDVLHRIQSFFS